MPDTARGSIEDVLFENKIITQDQLNLVKLESVNSGKSSEQLIKERGFASSLDIIKARSAILGIPYVDLTSRAILPEVLALVPEPVVRRYMVIPFELDLTTGILSVAMVDPLDINAISFLEKKTLKKIRPFLSTPEIIKTLADDRYNQGLTTEVSAALEEAPDSPDLLNPDLNKIEGVIRDAPVAKIISSLLDFAIKSRASDIHIEPFERDLVA